MKHTAIVESTPYPFATPPRRHRFRCRTCGAHSPWMSKEGAELARDGHVYETEQVGWSG